MEQGYLLTESEIRLIINNILGSYVVLYPLNCRYKAQQEFIKQAAEFNHKRKPTADEARDAYNGI